MSLSVKTILSERGMKQAELAAALDITPGYMSLLISGGRQPSHELLTRMAQVLDVPIGALFDGAQQGEKGFADSVQPFKAHMNDLRALARMLHRDARKPDTFTMMQPAHRFDLQKNDILVIDLGARPATGDLVVATEQTAGEGRSFVALWADPWLIPDDERTPIAVDDNQSVAILGPIIGSLRGARG